MLLMLAYPSLKDGFLPHLTIYLYLTWNTQYSTGRHAVHLYYPSLDCYIWWWHNTSISYLLPSEQPENIKLWGTGWWNGKSRRVIKLRENAKTTFYHWMNTKRYCSVPSPITFLLSHQQKIDKIFKDHVFLASI